MRLEEIRNFSAAEKRVDRLKANAKATKDRARQMKAQADASAEQLKMRQSREKLAQLHRATVGTTIKGYAE